MALRLLASVCLLAGLITVRASPLANTLVLHERREQTHPRWIKQGPVHPHTVFPMRIGLAQGNLDKAEGFLFDVSHPESDNYGKHWTQAQVNSAFEPSSETADAVREWVIASGVAAHRIALSDNKAWLTFDATSAEAEKLLQTQFHQFQDSETGQLKAACDEYHLPAHVQPHVDYVLPGIQLLASDERTGPKKQKRHGGLQRFQQPTFMSAARIPSDASDLSICDQLITPACIRALYQIPIDRPSPNPNNTLGIFETLNQFYYQADLDYFFAVFSPNIPSGTHPNPVSIDGGYPGSSANISYTGREANLDFMVAYPLVYPQTITNYATDDQYYGGHQDSAYTFGFNTFLDAIDGSYCSFSAYGETGDAPFDPHYPNPQPGGWRGERQCGAYQPANVMSFSYGGQEAYVPAHYQKRQCLEFLKLGLQGVTLVFASGDGGVGDYPGAATGAAHSCLGPNNDIFNPTWPSTCPYVTSVGATKMYPGTSVTNANPESAAADAANDPYPVAFASGGGFSNLFPQPAYQGAAVGDYIARHGPPYASYAGVVADASQIGRQGPGLYNRAGRGIPDLSAIGDNIATFIEQHFQTSGGTSASAPIVASIFNRVNEERMAAGKGPVGFVNPVLYAAPPDAFRDVVNGSNPGCGTEGFFAVPGWDPVTGLGTPNYPKLLEQFMNLP